MTNDELRTEMVGRFDNVATAFTNVGAEMAEALSQLLETIKADGETTRRHFDVMVEKMHDAVKIVAEATAHHTVRLDSHEKRLKRLERPPRS